ncbi:hypothetical protein N7540_009280 [Penicillium herquei]|nr:hypothetical protein N7540_009280 [Penicillium herquei]
MHFMKLAVALVLPLGVAYASPEPYESASQGVADINEFTGDVRDLTNTAQGWNGQWSDMVKIVKGMSSLQTRLGEINGRIKPMGNFTKEDETQYMGSVSDLLDAWTDAVASVQQHV